ncbi:xylulokinase [Aestuariivirga sp.]|uniref:xylulokinase n=1 Tax=Aestuariivirga sp. TaxID=2650926 RepID=UPI0025BA7638|nr:xylulokinase [Aestuariivirga sp.]MCA3555246.1 xylulokinase [Aestuariivirga sp.]
MSNSASSFLGIDIGTSSVKAVVVDGEQNILAGASAPLAVSRPQDLWSEQNPEDWWVAVGQAIAGLRHKAGNAWHEVKAIGLSGQMHGAVLLDAAGHPIRPAILHNDGRAHAEAAWLNAKLPGIGAIAGVPAMPGFSAPKLLWLARHEPEVFGRARHLLLPKDYARFRMTHGFATDMCDASGALLLDGAKRQWSPEIAAAAGIPLSMLPTALEGSAVSGLLQGSVAMAWGLSPGIIVAAGAGDAAAGAVASGAVNGGDAFISLGTATQYFAARGTYRPSPEHLIHTFCHALPGRWFQMAALLNGAGALAWAAGLMGRGDIGQLLEDTERAFTGPSALLFLPYLSGERTPHNNPHAKGVLFGLTPATTPEQVTQAVLEGVALSLADAQGCLEATGKLPDRIAVNGGGSKSRFWMKILASALNKSVLLQEGSEAGPAFGAARLARLAATGEDVAAVCSKPEIAAEIRPDPELAQIYAARLQKFRGLYKAVEPLF